MFMEIKQFNRWIRKYKNKKIYRSGDLDRKAVAPEPEK